MVEDARWLESAGCEALIVSDVHVRGPEDKRLGLLINLLQELGPKSRTVILLGDIFDFFLGSSQYFINKYKVFGEVLSKLAAQRRVIYLAGNHEFQLERVGWPGVEVFDQATLEVHLAGGTALRLTHGDLIYSSRTYLATRSLLKSRLAGRLARMVPQTWLDAYTAKHAKVSRAADSYRQLDREALVASMRVWLSGFAGHGIFGHFHTYVTDSHPQGRILSLRDWSQPNALAIVAGGFHRLEHKDSGWITTAV